MRCLYEVLGVAQDVDEKALKKSYRTLALQWHPDKNHDQADAAHERFQEIQNAWEVLSDPQERAWYNSHREQILRSGSHQAGASDDVAAESPYSEVDFAQCTSSGAFSGFGSDARGFYSVYAAVFSTIDAQEQEAYRRQKPIAKGLRRPEAAPAFGGAGAGEAGVKACYAHWSNFQTVKDFAWEDVYNAGSAPGRRIRRLMEAENERHRRSAKLRFVAAVRELAEYVKLHDPRIEAFRIAAEQRKAARAEAEAARREEQRAAKQAEADAYQDADWIRAGEEEQLAKMDAPVEDEGPSQMFECIVCDKLYKSEKALRNHEASKKHKEQLKRMKRVMRSEDGLGIEDLDL